jgi:hypothetical protein
MARQKKRPWRSSSAGSKTRGERQSKATREAQSLSHQLVCTAFVERLQEKEERSSLPLIPFEPLFQHGFFAYRKGYQPSSQ